MLKICKRQFEVFREVSKRNFIDDMIIHLRMFSPINTKRLSNDALGSVVEMGIARAGEYGFTRQGTVRLYLELMFSWGSEFDTDPQYASATTPLHKQSVGQNETLRARKLHKAVAFYLHKAGGTSGTAMLQALDRTITLTTSSIDFGGPDEDARIWAAVQFIWPEKSALIDQNELRYLVQHGRRVSGYYDAPAVSDNLLIVLFMFWFGHQCFADPQFPWLERIISERGVSPTDKCRLLKDSGVQHWRAMAYYLRRREDIA